jgi:DNA-binding NarL/FixJ family response regulator
MTDDATLRVLVCDDHPLFRRAVVTTLEDAGMDIVAEAATGAEAAQRAIDHAPDVTLMDLRMPGGTGIEATAAIRRARPWARVLVLTVSDDLDELLAAVRAGAVGHLRKEDSMAVLPDAVRAVHRGEVIVGPILARGIRLELDRLHREVVEPRRARGNGSIWSLSGRQRDLLAQLIDGADLAGAATGLGIDHATARTELRAVVEGLHRLALLAEAARDRG